MLRFSCICVPLRCPSISHCLPVFPRWTYRTAQAPSSPKLGLCGLTGSAHQVHLWAVFQYYLWVCTMMQPTHTCFGGRTHSTGSDRPSCSTVVKTDSRAHVGGGGIVTVEVRTLRALAYARMDVPKEIHPLIVKRASQQADTMAHPSLSAGTLAHLFHHPDLGQTHQS